MQELSRVQTVFLEYRECGCAVEAGVELRVIFGDLGLSSGVLRRPRAVPA